VGQLPQKQKNPIKHRNYKLVLMIVFWNGMLIVNAARISICAKYPCFSLSNMKKIIVQMY
jgi:hypothetical protein